MITFNITLDIACKGKQEDISNMKQRLKTIIENPAILEFEERLKELFGEELNEIQEDQEQIYNFFTCCMADNLIDSPEIKLDNENNEKDYTYSFAGLLYNWEKADIDNMQFSSTISLNEEDEDNLWGDNLEGIATYCGANIYLFTSSLEQVFPRVKFNFISYSAESGGKYYAAYENSDSYRDYYYFADKKEQLEMYLKWKKEFRKTWLLDQKTTEECHALKKALFNIYVDPNADEEDECYYSIDYTWQNHYS